MQHSNKYIFYTLPYEKKPRTRRFPLQGLHRGFKLTGSKFFTTPTSSLSAHIPKPQITELLLLLTRNWWALEPFSKNWGVRWNPKPVPTEPLHYTLSTKYLYLDKKNQTKVSKNVAFCILNLGKFVFKKSDLWVFEFLLNYQYYIKQTI